MARFLAIFLIGTYYTCQCTSEWGPLSAVLRRRDVNADIFILRIRRAAEIIHSPGHPVRGEPADHLNFSALFCELEKRWEERHGLSLEVNSAGEKLLLLADDILKLGPDARRSRSSELAERTVITCCCYLCTCGEDAKMWFATLFQLYSRHPEDIPRSPYYRCGGSINSCELSNSSSGPADGVDVFVQNIVGVYIQKTLCFLFGKVITERIFLSEVGDAGVLASMRLVHLLLPQRPAITIPC